MQLDSVNLLWGTLWAMGQLLVTLWPVTLIIALSFLVRIGFALHRNQRLAKSGIAELDKLNGEDFERYLEMLFKQLGYQVRRTPYQGDYGADLILSKDGEETSVQAKRYNSTVGVKAVQEAVAAKEYYGCTKAMVVTNSYFSQQARVLAKANRVELWDRNELVKQLFALKSEIPAPLQPMATAVPQRRSTTAETATCVQCGKTVSTKVRDYCLTHLEAFGGQVYCYDHQREMRKMQQVR